VGFQPHLDAFTPCPFCPVSWYPCAGIGMTSDRPAEYPLLGTEHAPTQGRKDKMGEPTFIVARGQNAVDVAVIGAGPTGLAAALALASAGCRTVCAGQKFNPDPARPDTRTTALLQASVRFLRNLGIWDECAPHAAPLEGIRIIDDTGGLIQAPEVTFHCSELGDEPFGYNIVNTDLVAALSNAAHGNALLEPMETRSAEISRIADDGVTVKLAEGQALEAGLVVAADGRNSVSRVAAGITTRGWTYEQTALACNFQHTRPHDNFSNEFHCSAGPFTTVPLPRMASSLVWVQRPGEAERLMELDDHAFCAEIEQRLHGVLGTVTDVGPRAAFPLSGLTPSAFACNRVALVGEAAHVIPPIGAQGLNLGFRDAATLAEIAGRALETSGDPGSPEALKAYHEARRADILTRTAAVDLLNRSLLTDLVPVQILRGAGLHLLKGVAPLRRFVMRQGVAPQTGLPALMRAVPGDATAP
jgi:2-octaprenyl-6-methoxyphenol hydroxylase